MEICTECRSPVRIVMSPGNRDFTTVVACLGDKCGAMFEDVYGGDFSPIRGEWWVMWMYQRLNDWLPGKIRETRKKLAPYMLSEDQEAKVFGHEEPTLAYLDFLRSVKRTLLWHMVGDPERMESGRREAHLSEAWLRLTSPIEALDGAIPLDVYREGDPARVKAVHRAVDIPMFMGGRWA